MFTRADRYKDAVHKSQTMITESPSRKVKSVGTAFRIIEILQELDGTSMNELATQLDLAKSTVHNYLQTLEALGYVVERDGIYRLGLRFLTHGMAAKNSLKVRDIVTHSLSQISEDLSQPTWWIVEEYGRGVFVDKQTSIDERAIYGRLGKRSYLHTHAPGKAILAQLSDEYVARVLDYHGLPTHTKKTNTDIEELMDELKEISKQGYAISDGEAALGVQSVGVAFEGPYGYTHALGIFGYSHDFTGSEQGEDIPLVLQNAVDNIEQATKREVE